MNNSRTYGRRVRYRSKLDDSYLGELDSFRLFLAPLFELPLRVAFCGNK